MMPQAVAAALSESESAFHAKALDFAIRRIRHAERHWSDRHEPWKENEQLYRAFRVPDRQDQQTRQQRLTEGVEKIVVPYSYAVLQSTLAFFMTVFTQRVPIIPVAGAGPGDVRAAIFHELILDYQCEQMRPTAILLLYQWLFDSLRYGVGIVKNAWTIREWPDLVRQVTAGVDPLTGQPTYDDTVLERDVIAYEGNEGSNVAPYDFLPDPSVTMGDFQNGEFVAHRLRRSWTAMRQRQAQGMYVGIDFVPKHLGGRGDNEFAHGGGQSDLARIAQMTDPEGVSPDYDGNPPVTLHELWAYCDPGRDLGVPEAVDGATPKLWVITVANKARVVRVEPANLPGRRFPFEVIEPNYDLHSPSNVGQIEMFRGLQYIYSWLYNSRMQSVRKTLNNQLVVDPSMVEEADLLSEDPGLLVRLKRQHWQAGAVREAVFPLPVQDVTQSHLSVDAPYTRELIDLISGANNLIMGVANTGRRSATEVQGQLQLASGRMKMLIELVSRQGVMPWAKQMIRNNQTFLDGQTLRLREPYAKLFGQPMIEITPEMLQGEFTVPIAENGIPTDRQLESNLWKEMLQMGMQSGVAPPIPPQFWQVAISRFLWANGVKDIQTAGLTMQNLTVTPDEAVQAQVQQGNLAPMAEPTMSSDGFPLPPSASVPGTGMSNGNGSYA